MKKLIAVMVMMTFAGSVYGMGLMPRKPKTSELEKLKRTLACVQEADRNATERDANGLVTKRDDAKLTAGYCACYTANNDTELMKRYCK